MNNLAVAYSNTGQLDRALPMYEECLRRSKVALGEDHPETLGTMSNLASAYLDSDQLDLALPLLESTLKLTKAKMGEDHPDTIDSMTDLATGYNRALRFDEGVPLLEESVRRAKAVLGREHGLTLNAVNNLAMIFRTIGKLDQALPLYLEAYEIRKSQLGLDHPQTIVTGAGLAATYRDLGNLDLAVSHYRPAVVALERRKFAHPAAEPIVADACDCLERLKQFDVAEDWRRKWLAHTKERNGPESLQAAGALAGLGANLLEQEKFDEATLILRECMSVREKSEPAVWTTFNAQSMLGAALLGQNKQVEAEPLLLGGLEGLKRSAATIPPQFRHSKLTRAYERIIKLMEASGKSEEAAKWQKELDELKP
jgi:tetratricopeptide (TPR) repeat protein